MDPLDFWKKYKLLASTKDFVSEPRSPRVCRFCHADEGVTSFQMRAHVLPELMGANDIFTFEECDSCNQKFSAYESHMAVFFRPYLTTVGVKGKKKIPEFHSRAAEDNTKAIFRYKDDRTREFILNNPDDYNVDEKNRKASITFRLQPHRPRNVYKGLLKIALSILPTQSRDRYRNLFDWLMDRSADVTYLPSAFITVLQKKKFNTPYAELLEARQVIAEKSFVPELTLIVRFANIIIQIFLPLSHEFDYDASRGKSPTLHLFPGFIFNIDFEEAKRTQEVHYSFAQIDLQLDKSVSYDQTIDITFERLDRDIELTNGDHPIF